jgi:hypothetical protein
MAYSVYASHRAYRPKLSTGSSTGSVDFLYVGECGPNFSITTKLKKSLKYLTECRQIYIESYTNGIESVRI